MWNNISVNFVVKLPELSEYNVVITVVDSVSKRAYFILTHTTVTVESMVRLFLHHVWKLYSLPNCIISDRGSHFVVLFTKKLYCLLRVEITPLIAWYLQLDRQTEQVNQKLNQCHMQVHLSETYIPMVISSPNYTSLPSTAVTFLATRLTVVLQPSGYSIFHSGNTPIQLGLP